MSNIIFMDGFDQYNFTDDQYRNQICRSHWSEAAGLNAGGGSTVTPFSRGASHLLNNDSWNLIRTNPDISLNIANKAEKYSLSIDYKKGLAFSKINQAWYYCDLPNYPVSFELFFEASELFKEISNREVEIY